MKSAISQSRYCAYCKAPRRIYLKRHVTATNVWLSFLLSVVVTLAVWNTLDPRALFLFGIFLSVAEVFVQLRWRLGLRCQHCGFDPVIYLRDPNRAADIVKAQFQDKSQRLEFFFTESPLLRKAAMSKMRSQRMQKHLEARGPEGQMTSPISAHKSGLLDLESADSLRSSMKHEVVDGGMTRTVKL